MKKKAAAKLKAAKSARTDEVWHPPPHPLPKRPPKNNLGHIPEQFRKLGLLLGPDYRVPGRPTPRIRPSKPVRNK